MGIGVSILLIALGLIMAFAVNVENVAGIDLNVVGIILAVCGFLGLIITMVIFAPRRSAGARNTPPQQQYYRDDRGAY